MITLIILIALVVAALCAIAVRDRIRQDRAQARQLAQLTRRPGSDDQFGGWPRVRVPSLDSPTDGPHETSA